MQPGEELDNLMSLLKALQSGEMTIHQKSADGVSRDVTQSEIQKLTPDIEYLKSVLKRSGK